ncbi:MAG: hypothetical protein HC828_18195 [Blastochloris sp.]|nr:hypothetical protein [Blastochloris sp.]
MSHDFMHPQLHEHRKQALMQQARLQRLARTARSQAYGAGLPARLLVLLGDMMIAGGTQLKSRGTVHSAHGFDRTLAR